MISCDECQRKLVALFDNEAGKDDEKLIDAHLKDCCECRVFRQDMVRLRQRFVSITMPGLPASVRDEIMQLAHTDSRRGEDRRRDEGPQRRPLLLRFPRLVWGAGLAALFLIAASWVVSYNLARKVEALKQELETSRREIALAKEKEHLEQAQERQQKAISALYFRMQELETRFDRYSSPRTTFLPGRQNGRFHRPDDM
ncbi:MAG: hypothetical protein JSW66_19340 [Phycisphaerales bacterium]|nr:MAG: hypothetical protein JSW66_19340 [Phycisphaerales bacterium]